MKKTTALTIVIISLLFALLLGGCGQPAASTPAATTKGTTSAASPGTPVASGYTFSEKGVAIQMNAPAAAMIGKLGEPQNYFEAESCAFQGLDKTYTYSSFEITTYPIDKVDYINSVALLDDNVATAEGVRIGASAADVEAAYGKDFKDVNGSRVYTNGKSTLTFILENDVVTSIEYTAITQ